VSHRSTVRTTCETRVVRENNFGITSCLSRHPLGNHPHDPDPLNPSQSPSRSTLLIDSFVNFDDLFGAPAARKTLKIKGRRAKTSNQLNGQSWH
jgi:hypothetical protein